jgi:hypothetical protein
MERETYAAFEWTIPTTFFVFIGGAMVEALIKEAAKEYTPKLLSGLKALALRCRDMNIRWLSATEATEKLSRKYQQSAGFSIIIQTKTGKNVKMLFDQELSPAEWEDAIDGMLGTMATNHVHYPDDVLTKSAIMQAAKPHSPLYVMYNRERKEWEFHNDQTMLEHQRNSPPPAEK